jgi:hypothetical protein
MLAVHVKGGSGGPAPRRPGRRSEMIRTKYGSWGLPDDFNALRGLGNHLASCGVGRLSSSRGRGAQKLFWGANEDFREAAGAVKGRYDQRLLPSPSRWG